MALTAAEQALLVFKKDLNKGSTGLAFDFFEEPFTSRRSVILDQIWAQSDMIPDTAPGSTTGVVELHTDEALTVVLGTSNAFQTDALKDAIPFNFGDGVSYNYTLKDGLGNVIPFGVGNWVVDPDAGIVTFYSAVPANMPPTITFYKYVGTKGAASGPPAGSKATFVLANAISSPTDVTGMVFDKTMVTEVTIHCEVRRKDSLEERVAVGDLHAYYLASTDTWEILDTLGGNIDDGIDFSITSGGQVQYTSDTMAGTGYSGLITFISDVETSLGNFTIGNNVSAPVDVTALVFDKLSVTAVTIWVGLRRMDSIEERVAVGYLHAYYLASTDTWELIDELGGNIDDGVDFSITSAGQIQLASDNMGGTGYTGSMSFFTSERILVGAGGGGVAPNLFDQIVLRANGKTISIQAPAALAADYSLDLPGSLGLAGFLPTGALIPFAGSSAPAGFLLCDGSAVSRTTYAPLYAVIGDAHGNGDGSTTFNLPDSRGRFMRFVDAGAGVDPDALTRAAMNTGGNTGDSVGTVQGDAMKYHNHSTGVPTFHAGGSVTDVLDSASNTGGGTSFTSSTEGNANENRPVNFNANLLIKT